jgi:hypothetical protein
MSSLQSSLLAATNVGGHGAHLYCASGDAGGNT